MLFRSKAPGTTGLNSGYFLEIWPYAGTLITRSINDCLESGTLPSKQREGVIVLIPKQDKDQRIIGNLRPITLLNCFYKIISGVLTNRMKPVLQKIIGNHQKAYLPGRYIGECTRTVHDIMDYAIKNDIPSLAMLVDFKKAFDSVSHSFIKNAMRKFKFSEKFIHWINTLLSGFKSRTLVNGCLGDIIDLERGCRQGDPVAGYLFILAIEVLLLKLFASKNITPWTSKKNLQTMAEGYADDLTLLLKSLGFEQDLKQLKEILDILDHFRRISGLTINKSKTQICAFGHVDNPTIFKLADNTRIE